MIRCLAAIFLSILLAIDGQVLLYNTEDEEAVEKFDCVYYVPNYGEEILYCRREDGLKSRHRPQNQCDNQGEKIFFGDLLKHEIDPHLILKLSSSVEMADLYARLFYNRSLINDLQDEFLCNCTVLGTFGKYCQYQLTHQTESFSKAIKAQFIDKQTGDHWNTQRYGKILCYETLDCLKGPLCLDWREFCDGIQRCADGFDEQNCDKLEFNECEDDEFRCTNGMCIAEEFWLDGTFDCMDWSDELLIGFSPSCSFNPSALLCDEHVCGVQEYSCGDGECIPWRTRMAFLSTEKTGNDCFNKRNLNYMCEFSKDPVAWTGANGLCQTNQGYDDFRYPRWNIIDRFGLTLDEKCEYLFRCLLSNGLEHDCPCNAQNCSQLMMNVCRTLFYLIPYPRQGLINSNYFFWYNYSKFTENLGPQLFELRGGIRCQGYFFQSKVFATVSIDLQSNSVPFNHDGLCRLANATNGIIYNWPAYQNDEFCWNHSSTFSGRPYAVDPEICRSSGKCISQYRIRDGVSDCNEGDDETKAMLNKNYCTGNAGRHHFQCFNDEHKCLPPSQLGGTSICSNKSDYSWYGTGPDIRFQLTCYQDSTKDCHLLREYIRRSSPTNSTNDNSLADFHRQEPMSRMPFQQYCDTFGDLDKHIDENRASCRYWVCQNYEYQCLTGQCIPLEWVCDGEWDCSDASDEEAIVLIKKRSDHNARLPNISFHLSKCEKRYSSTTFSRICNTSFEFGCYRSGVSDPLNITRNRPCINLTQIGDANEDCYNAYDEKNTLISNSYIGGSWGFHSRCGSKHVIYQDTCNIRNKCTEILCSFSRNCSNTKDFMCPEDNYCKEAVRCNQINDCLNGEDEYWCPSDNLDDQIVYRFSKLQKLRQNKNFSLDIIYPSNERQQQLSNSNGNLRNDQSFKVSSYQCQRGIAVLERNETRCLCPPGYYGLRCEFFSDRVSIIVHLDYKETIEKLSNQTYKIRAKFLFNHQVIDDHQFDIIPHFEQDKIIKHQFYFLYSRSREMIQYKQDRFVNRTDITVNHPYAIEFDLFVREMNESVQEIGSWHYPFYFDYLPVFRLALVLKMPFWFRNSTLDPCQQNNCNNNSICLPIFSSNNSSYYCSCKSGYYGEKCSIYEPSCENYCSSNALCQVDLGKNKRKIHCICPSNSFGARCHLKNDECRWNPCWNNGTCQNIPDRSGENTFFCTCFDRYYGSKCENEKSSVHIRLNMTKISSALATVVQLYNFEGQHLALKIESQQIHHGIPSSVTSYHSSIEAPVLGILKMYTDLSSFEYFLMYALSEVNITRTLSPAHCPHASLLLSQVPDIDRSITIALNYHRLCGNHTARVCFYDENYFCICQVHQHRVQCFAHNVQLDHCEKCLSGGKCLQGDVRNPNNFLCLCPSCHQGHRCEFSMQAFGFSLDSLMIDDSTTIKLVYVCIVCLLFIVGLLNNLCSLMTFRRSAPRKFRVGNYLLIISFLNQLALFVLLFKLAEMINGTINIVSCKSISYLLSVLTRSTYWLTSWISVDRLLMILFPVSSSLKNARLSILISILTLTALFVMHIHEIIFYTMIEHFSTKLLICVTNFNIKWISTYNRISTLINYLCPFCIQIICITSLIILAARSRMKTAGKQMTFAHVLKRQFASQKELYVTPLIIIISALPQAILSFSLACTQLNDWQRHLLLISYLLSYAPQVLGFLLYVLPSTSYKKEFYQTQIGMKYFQMDFYNEKE